jgi:hypothetical protein
MALFPDIGSGSAHTEPSTLAGSLLAKAPAGGTPAPASTPTPAPTPDPAPKPNGQGGAIILQYPAVPAPKPDGHDPAAITEMAAAAREAAKQRSRLK